MTASGPFETSGLAPKMSGYRAGPEVIGGKVKQPRLTQLGPQAAPAAVAKAWMKLYCNGSLQ
jgi:hypothetical protein